MLVLQEFRMDKGADEFLCIRGKQSGGLATVLTWIGMGPVTALRCNRSALKFVSSSIKKGNQSVSVPTSAVTAVVAGFCKPFGLLVGAVFSAVVSFSSLMAACFGDFGGDEVRTVFGVLCFGFVVCGIVAVVRYIKTAFLQISVYDGGDVPIIAMRVKRSVVDGVTVDLEKFQSAADLLNEAVIESRSGVGNRREIGASAT